MASLLSDKSTVSESSVNARRANTGNSSEAVTEGGKIDAKSATNLHAHPHPPTHPRISLGQKEKVSSLRIKLREQGDVQNQFDLGP